MNFINAIRNVSEIAECLKNGLQAFERQNRKKIKVNSSRDLKGSVYIDKCLERRYPNEHRWDYVFGYKDRIYYVEVHQGRASEIENVIAKLDWLRQWRKQAATSLEDLKDRSTYHWISTGKIESAFAKNNVSLVKRDFVLLVGARSPRP